MPTDQYDLLINYRRESGAEAARLMRETLVQKHCRVFLDGTDLREGYFDETLLTVIAQTPSFMVVVSPNSLERSDARQSRNVLSPTILQET